MPQGVGVRVPPLAPNPNCRAADKNRHIQDRTIYTEDAHEITKNLMMPITGQLPYPPGDLQESENTEHFQNGEVENSRQMQVV